jgi:hypothetical protein
VRQQNSCIQFLGSPDLFCRQIHAVLVILIYYFASLSLSSLKKYGCALFCLLMYRVLIYRHFRPCSEGKNGNPVKDKIGRKQYTSRPHASQLSPHGSEQPRELNVV